MLSRSDSCSCILLLSYPFPSGSRIFLVFSLILFGSCPLIKRFQTSRSFLVEKHKLSLCKKYWTRNFFTPGENKELAQATIKVTIKDTSYNAELHGLELNPLLRPLSTFQVCLLLKEYSRETLSIFWKSPCTKN